EFDLYASNSTEQDRGIPVRMFSKEALHREIDRAGLEVVDWQQFSYVRPEKVDGFASLYGVPADCVRDFGVSQYVAVRHARAREVEALPSLRSRLAWRPR